MDRYLERIAIALESLIAINGKAPEWEYPIEMFPTFDWGALGIEVVDASAKQVKWMGHIYTQVETEGGTLYQRACGHLTTAVLISFYKSEAPT